MNPSINTKVSWGIIMHIFALKMKFHQQSISSVDLFPKMERHVPTDLPASSFQVPGKTCQSQLLQDNPILHVELLSMEYFTIWKIKVIEMHQEWNLQTSNTTRWHMCFPELEGPPTAAITKSGMGNEMMQRANQVELCANLQQQRRIRQSIGAFMQVRAARASEHNR